MASHETVRDIITQAQAEGRFLTIEETLQVGLIPAQWIFDLVTTTCIDAQERLQNLDLAQRLRQQNRERFLELSEFDFWPRKNHK